MEEYHSDSRRKFLKQAAIGFGAAHLASLPAVASSSAKEIGLTILHTNDVHSHIDPFEANDPKYPNKGGVAWRSALIRQIRSEQKNVLLLDAGDIFQGTPYFNLYGGEPEIKLMSMMGYDAATLGNHDFDNGIEGFVKQMPHANFPILNCNYDFTGTDLYGRTLPCKIFIRDGIRIGVFGIGIELEGLVDKKLYGNIKYIDPVMRSLNISSYLKRRKKCDLVICLSHLGFQYKDNKISDLNLAKKTKDIDLIIGGHTHTFLDEPVAETNLDGKKVLVTQAGWAGLKLGRIDYIFERGRGSKPAPYIQRKN